MKEFRFIEDKIFDRAVNNNRLLELAITIKIKSTKTNSCIKNYNHTKFAKILGVKSKNTAKRYLKLLIDCKVAKFIGKTNTTLQIRNLRLNNTKDNIGVYFVKVDDIDKSSIKSILKGLRALYILEVAKRKKSLKTLVNYSNGNGFPPDVKHKSRKINSAKRKLATKYPNVVFITNLKGEAKYIYKENGISRTTLKDKLKCGSQTLTDIVKYGKKQKWFRTRNHKPIKTYIGSDIYNYQEYSDKPFHYVEGYYGVTIPTTKYYPI